MSVMETLKEHPVMIIGGAAALAVGYFLLSGSSSSSSGSASSQAALLSSYQQAQLQNAQLSMQANAQNAQIGLQESQLQAQTQLGLAQTQVAETAATGTAIGNITTGMGNFLQAYQEPVLSAITQAGNENQTAISSAAATQIEGLNVLSNSNTALGTAVQGMGASLANVTNQALASAVQNTKNNTALGLGLIGGALKMSGGIP